MSFYISRFRRPECEGCKHRAGFSTDGRYVLCEYETVSSLLKKKEEIMSRIYRVLRQERVRNPTSEAIMQVATYLKLDRDLRDVEEELKSKFRCPYEVG